MKYRIYRGHIDECSKPEIAPETAYETHVRLLNEKAVCFETCDIALVAEVLSLFLTGSLRLWYECADMQAHPISVVGLGGRTVELLEIYLSISAAISKIFMTDPHGGGVVTVALNC